MTAAPLPRPTFCVRLALPGEAAVPALRARFTATPDLAGRWRGKERAWGRTRCAG